MYFDQGKKKIYTLCNKNKIERVIQFEGQIWIFKHQNHRLEPSRWCKGNKSY